MGEQNLQLFGLKQSCKDTRAIGIYYAERCKVSVGNFKRYYISSVNFLYILVTEK